MKPVAHISPVAAATLCALSACVDPEAGSEGFEPVYLGVDTRLMGDDLVNFRLKMQGARGPSDVEDYAECAAAQYALIRGFGFARHVRTNVARNDELWEGDSVYTISSALPKGLKTIDAEVVSAACVENGIAGV